MDLRTWITPVAAVAGLLIAAVNTWHAISEVRAKRFFQRSKDLLELRDVLTSEGRLQRDEVSENVDMAHLALIREFETEARANAVLYLEATSQLTKPGSLAKGIGLVIYAAFLLWTAFEQFSSNAELAGAQLAGAIIAESIIVVGALALTCLGTRQLARRWKTRRLRGTMGVVDPLTIEGSRWMLGVPKAIAQRTMRGLRNIGS